MSNISILGFSDGTFAIVIDILKENLSINEFKNYNNIEINKEINFPIFLHKYESYNPGTFPSTKDKVVFGLSGPFNKWSVFNYFKEQANINKERYTQLFHQQSYIAKSSFIEAGVLIEPAAVVSSQTHIGFGASVKRGVLVGHHNKIGDFVDLNPGVVLSGNVNVGKGCVIGSGAIISDNITIGENCMIGAGSVVTKDIPAGVVAYGNPCKVIRKNDKWAI